MGAPGTLIPAEVPSGHHQNFGLDARSFATVAGTNKNSCIASDKGAIIRSFSPSVDETPKTSSSSSEPSAIAIQLNRRGRRIAGKILTEQLEHHVEDLYLPPEGAYEESLHAGNNKSTGRDSLVKDASSYATGALKEPKSTRELPTTSLEKCASTQKDLFPKTNTHDFREDEVLERNGLVRRDRVVDQCRAEIYLSENEHSLIPYTGLQLLNMSCNSSRKRSAEGLGANLFKLESVGHKSSLNPPGELNVLADNRNDEVASNDDTAIGRELVDFSGNAEAMLISCVDQSNASKIHNVQIDPVLNGVAEILWEDLQIGERIGIGKNCCSRFLIPYWKLRFTMRIEQYVYRSVSVHIRES